MLISQTFEYYFIIFETKNLFLVHLILLNHSICSVLPTSPSIKTTCQSVHQAEQDCLQVISSNLYFEYDERPHLQDGLQEVSSSLHCKYDKYALLSFFYTVKYFSLYCKYDKYALFVISFTLANILDPKCYIPKQNENVFFGQPRELLSVWLTLILLTFQTCIIRLQKLINLLKKKAPA